MDRTDFFARFARLDAGVTEAQQHLAEALRHDGDMEIEHAERVLADTLEDLHAFRASHSAA
jgi:hypothetical protein